MYACACVCHGRYGSKKMSDIQSHIMKSKLCMTQELPSSLLHIPSLNGSFVLQFLYKNKHWHKILFFFFFFSANTLTITLVAASSGLCMSLLQELVYAVYCSD